MTKPDNKQAIAGLSSEERRAVETLYRAFSEANPALLDEAVTADWQDSPLAPHQQSGREGMKPLIRQFQAAFPDLRITLLEMIGTPGRAAVRGLIAGTHKGEWLGIAPTGMPFQMPIHDFHHIADGKITHTWHLEDWFGWLFQVGAWPVARQEATRMKAARIRDYNTAPTLTEVAVPAPGADDVLVRIRAAALNPLDVKLQQGSMHQFFPLTFPYTLGTDFVGEVEQVGTNVRDWKKGDEVIARADPTEGGAVAEFAVVPSHYLSKPPASVPLEDAAGIPTAAGTAWQALFEIAKLQRNQSILIHAGAGGVGSFAIQFARQVGARVIATASGDGLEIARRLGADIVIDYRSEDFTTKVSDMDVVLETIGGDTQLRSYGVLRAGGILVATSAPPDEALAKAHNVVSAFVFHISDGERLRRVASEIEAGAIEVLIDARSALGGFDKAFERQSSGRARGKIILVMT